MGTGNTPEQLTLTLSRVFDAPRAAVFNAWTDRDEILKWWAPEGFSETIVEINLRVGGVFRFGFTSPKGDRIEVTGTFKEVDPPKKLVYTWKWETVKDWKEQTTLVTVVFKETVGQTELVLTHENFPDEKTRESHTKGWNSCLDRIMKIV